MDVLYKFRKTNQPGAETPRLLTVLFPALLCLALPSPALAPVIRINLSILLISNLAAAVSTI
jgi:hypothetical protein